MKEDKKKELENQMTEWSQRRRNSWDVNCPICGAQMACSVVQTPRERNDGLWLMKKSCTGHKFSVVYKQKNNLKGDISDWKVAINNNS